MRKTWFIAGVTALAAGHDVLAADIDADVDELKAFSDQRGHTAGQVALAWLLAQPYAVAPIPGTKRAVYVRENAAASSVPLSADDVAVLNEMFAPDLVRGEQYGHLDIRTR